MTAYTAPVCADIDLDGYQEVLYSDRVYDKDGVLLYSMGAVGVLRWPVPVNTDSDDEAEVFLASDRLSLWESDGTLIYAVPIPTEYPGPPCAADFDGDGAVEIAVPATTALHLFDTDGTLLWSAPISHAGMAGCSSCHPFSAARSCRRTFPTTTLPRPSTRSRDIPWPSARRPPDRGSRPLSAACAT